MTAAKTWLGMQEPRRAAPLTPELIPMRRRAMVWSALGIVMLLTNMTFRGHPVLALMTALTVACACWLSFRFFRAQIPNDVAFWTPERVRAWDAGERDMRVIAAIPVPIDAEGEVLPPLEPDPLTPPDRPLRPEKVRLS